MGEDRWKSAETLFGEEAAQFDNPETGREGETSVIPVVKREEVTAILRGGPVRPASIDVPVRTREQAEKVFKEARDEIEKRPSLTQHRADIRRPASKSDLEREREVKAFKIHELLKEGKRDKDIYYVLIVSYATIRYHRGRLCGCVLPPDLEPPYLKIAKREGKGKEVHERLDAGDSVIDIAHHLKLTEAGVYHHKNRDCKCPLKIEEQPPLAAKSFLHPAPDWSRPPEPSVQPIRLDLVQRFLMDSRSDS